jgi:hypothetical protein
VIELFSWVEWVLVALLSWMLAAANAKFSRLRSCNCGDARQRRGQPQTVVVDEFQGALALPGGLYDSLIG